jgi:hypothetical protein
MTFLILLFGHLLADFPLQSHFMATTKGQNRISLFSHSGIWTGTVLIAAYLIGYQVTVYDVFTFFIVHVILDFAKAKPVGFYKKLNPLGMGLALDQILHVLQILVFMIYKS